MEAIGGRYFNSKEYVKAHDIYFSQVFDKESKLHKIMDILNPLMELEDYDNLRKTSISSDDVKSLDREKIKAVLYAPQKIGENYLQVNTMIASMLHDKVENKEGKKVSLWEAFDKDGNWKTEEFGELSDKMIYRMSNKVQRINQMIHGRYSTRDAAIVTQGVMWRAAFQFKKWIPSALEARFGSKRFDDRLGTEVEGRYRTYSTLFSKNGWSLMLASLTNNIKAIEEGNFTETDIYNMRKNMTELVILAGTVLAAWALGGAGDNDKDLKKQALYKFTMQQLDRLSGDLLFFMNPAEMNRNLNQGLPILKTNRDLFNAISNIPYIFGIEDIGYLTDKEYDKGPRVNENKGLASLIDITPGVKPIADIIRNFKDEPYQEINKK